MALTLFLLSEGFCPGQAAGMGFFPLAIGYSPSHRYTGQSLWWGLLNSGMK